MSTATAEIDALIDAYLAGNQPYMVFWRRFMEVYTGDDLSEADAIVYEPAYDIVYMGGPGEPRPEERSAGVLGESDVREQLRAFRARLQRPASA